MVHILAGPLSRLLTSASLRYFRSSPTGTHIWHNSWEGSCHGSLHWHAHATSSSLLPVNIGGASLQTGPCQATSHRHSFAIYGHILPTHPGDAALWRAFVTPPYNGTPTPPPVNSYRRTQVVHCLRGSFSHLLTSARLRHLRSSPTGAHWWHNSWEGSCNGSLYQHANIASSRLLQVHQGSASLGTGPCSATSHRHSYAINGHLLPTYPGGASLGRPLVTTPYIDTFTTPPVVYYQCTLLPQFLGKTLPRLLTLTRLRHLRSSPIGVPR